ncbi:hypothetical protein KY363_04875 [Candidatus Woesearchaeota archaeon]|nr:hypothetical protein [Candidatus Woesearchaeota archaeon]
MDSTSETKKILSEIIDGLDCGSLDISEMDEAPRHEELCRLVQDEQSYRRSEERYASELPVTEGYLKKKVSELVSRGYPITAYEEVRVYIQAIDLIGEEPPIENLRKTFLDLSTELMKVGAKAAAVDLCLEAGLGPDETVSYLIQYKVKRDER